MVFMGLIMLMVMVSVLSWMQCGGYRATWSGAYSAERSRSNKASELYRLGALRKVSAAEMLIFGVLKYGAHKGGISAMKKEQYAPNSAGYSMIDAARYTAKHIKFMSGKLRGVED